MPGFGAMGFSAIASNPYVRRAAIGAAVGGAIGANVGMQAGGWGGLATGTGMLRGARTGGRRGFAAGAVVGAGVGLGLGSEGVRGLLGRFGGAARVGNRASGWRSAWAAGQVRSALPMLGRG